MKGRLVLGAALALTAGAGGVLATHASARPAAPQAAAVKTWALPLTNFKFGAKTNNVVHAKLHDILLFTWKSGLHNVVGTKAPTGLKKANSGKPVQHHAPLKVTLTKKGTYSFICQPHAALGMKLSVIVS
jgi:plastocyanin